MWKWSDLKRLLKRQPVSDTHNLGAIMWPVVYPADMLPPKEPHVTVIYFGEIDRDDLGFTKEDVLDAIKENVWSVYLWLKPIGVEWFGPEQNVPVLRVEHDYLPVFWESMKKTLRARGIPFDETYPEYKPHVTMTDEAALSNTVPAHLLAGPVELWWGDEHITIDDDEYKQIMLNRDGKP